MPSGVAVGDAAFGQIVGGDFDGHLVADGNADEIFTDLAGDVRQHRVSVIELHAVHRAGQYFNHRPVQ